MIIEKINKANNSATVTLTIQEIQRLRTAVIWHKMECLEDGMLEETKLDDRLSHELFKVRWKIRQQEKGAH